LRLATPFDDQRRHRIEIELGVVPPNILTVADEVIE
jgi:hypothetical protein